GVPEDVAASVNKERKSGLNEALYDAIVAVVTGAPKAVTIKQVVFVLHKLVAAGSLEEVPAESTVRTYLNRARENGDIGKPSRQSYWTVASDAGEADEAEAGEAAGTDTVAGGEAAPEAQAQPETDEDFDPLA
ncbi:hypothetical protein, partial [Klebsiella pneumoniae]|uniref:hypothetical protein n=1 Tax=Klebsiella pneumoniae TaxID=573 RepID=UPI001E3ADDE1